MNDETCATCFWHIYDGAGVVDRVCINPEGEYHDYVTEDGFSCGAWTPNDGEEKR